MYDLAGLELVTVVGLSVLLLTALAHRIRTPPSVLLFAGGIALSFLPPFADVTIRPEIVILIFLPVLLYWEARTTSLREIRSALPSVLSSAVLLVILTAAAVGAVGYAAGLPWPVAFVLGAVVAPTDATAVGSAATRLPHSQLSALRAESLINDGTALVVFAVAVSVATGSARFSPVGAVTDVVVSYAGGVLIGALIAPVAARARRLTGDRLLRNGVSVVTPFAAFLAAELLHVSGVVAVVVYGLTHARLSPRWVGARTRLQSHAFWGLVTFLLNGALFVLVGLQLRSAVDDLGPGRWRETLVLAVGVVGTVVAVRLVWFLGVPTLGVVVRRPSPVRLRTRVPTAWAGFRGGVSLAAALAIPATTVSGAPFPARAEIVVVTFAVIVATLVGQGLSLPVLLRWARFADDHRLADERTLAERKAAEAALDALPGEAARLGTHPEALDRVRAAHERALARAEGAADPPDGTGEAALELSLLAARRDAVLRLRDDGLVDDVVLLDVQGVLDREEARLRGILGPP